MAAVCAAGIERDAGLRRVRVGQFGQALLAVLLGLRLDRIGTRDVEHRLGPPLAEAACRVVAEPGPDARAHRQDDLDRFFADRVAQVQYIAAMKTATIPSVRVEPEFRAEVESVLSEGESLSEFVEASVRAGVERRRVQAEFIARGLRSRDEARRTGDYIDADDVVAALQRRLHAARVRVPKTRK